MTQTYTVAISPCPNDTFIFAGWLLGRAGELEDMAWTFLWEDVEDLNLIAANGLAHVIKVSASQALRLADRFHILSSGAAFGLEHGPRLVCRPGKGPRPGTIAVPGLNTTAFQLLACAMRNHQWTPVPMVYDAIVGAVVQGEVDAGLLIHESALVYERHGLVSLLDLGRWWRDRTQGLPLPLGCILIDKGLGSTVPARVEELIRKSLEWAGSHRTEVQPLLKTLAQELDDRTLDAHIRAYVNELSLDMGSAGREALDALRALMHA